MTSPTTDTESPKTLEKELGLFDVYAICTGAMFSSGFFLLPGIAASQTGASVVLAYLISGFLILPATFCAAELATAMPKAGGAYYFLDRALGPMVGTVGGIGTWISLVLKSAFALVGMGAYVALFGEFQIKPVAVALIVAFTLLNIIGAKESSGFQRILVAVLVAVLAYFVVEGFASVFEQPWGETSAQLSGDNWMTAGASGLFATVGLVFVSYAGLTKVASVSEEVRNPDRNVPLGMLLSLGSTIFIYCAGVFVMVVMLEPSAFHEDLTPVATAAEAFFDWFPGDVGLYLVVVAAVAAFASTGNAGIMSASRYPLAMSRDQLVPGVFGKIGRFKTPTISIILTGAVMVFAVLALDVKSLAKLASAVQLILFGFLCLAVIVMRESKIEYYHPGFHSPLYPWIPLAGIIIPIWLVIEMGPMPALFSAAITVLSIAWFYLYVGQDLEREGAIYHVFERLGQKRYDGLHHELRRVIAEKGLSEEDAFEQLVAEAEFVEVDRRATLTEALALTTVTLDNVTEVDLTELEDRLLEELEAGLMPVSHGIAVPHLRVPGLQRSKIALVRLSEGTSLDSAEDVALNETIYGIICLVSPAEHTGEHLRVLAQIASRIDDTDFRYQWMTAESGAAIKMLLLRDEHFYHVRVQSGEASETFIGQKVRELELPRSALVALIRRYDSALVPSGDTVVEEGDEIVFIGSDESIDMLRDQFSDE
ncbi:MAG: amino acid permease [Persicimonas sp.]